MEQNQLMEDKALRQRNVHKVEVLSKVGGLLMLPGDTYATTEQVANFYGVTTKALLWIIKHNEDEILEDGYKVFKKKDIQELFHESKSYLLSSKQGFVVKDENDNIILQASNRGIGLFTKRAILRIGMLLQDSEVAKEVRTRLLNIYDAATSLTDVVEKEVSTIKDELEALAYELGKAMLDGDYEKYMTLNTKANALKAQQLEELNEKLKEQKIGEDGIYTGEGLIKFFQNEGLVNSYASGTMFNEWMATMGYMEKPGKFYTPTDKFIAELANKGYAFTHKTKSGNIRAHYRIGFVQLMINHHMDSLSGYINSKTKAMTKEHRNKEKEKKAPEIQKRKEAAEARKKEEADKRRQKKVMGKSTTEPKVVVLRNAKCGDKFGFSSTCITRCCNGERKTHGGYTWEHFK